MSSLWFLQQGSYLRRGLESTLLGEGQHYTHKATLRGEAWKWNCFKIAHSSWLNWKTFLITAKWWHFNIPMMREMFAVQHHLLQWCPLCHFDVIPFNTYLLIPISRTFNVRMTYVSCWRGFFLILAVTRTSGESWQRYFSFFRSCLLPLMMHFKISHNVIVRNCLTADYPFKNYVLLPLIQFNLSHMYVGLTRLYLTDSNCYMPQIIR